MTSAVYIYYTPSWQELADIVLPGVREYCERHDYALNIIKADYGTPGYYKMIGLQPMLKHYDLVWLLDLDTLITNQSIPFMQFVDNQHDIFITKDINGINAGSWIIRNTIASHAFVDAVINDFDAPEEQTVMKRYLDMVKIKYLPQRSINSYCYDLYEMEYEDGEWQPQDLLLHLPGLQLQQRIDIFKAMI